MPHTHPQLALNISMRRELKLGYEDIDNHFVITLGLAQMYANMLTDAAWCMLTHREFVDAIPLRTSQPRQAEIQACSTMPARDTNRAQEHKARLAGHAPFGRPT
jgi:hypothetical protein